MNKEMEIELDLINNILREYPILGEYDNYKKYNYIIQENEIPKYASINYHSKINKSNIDEYIKYGNKEMIEYLFEMIKNLIKVDYDNIDKLFINACKYNNLSLAKKLFDKGANPKYNKNIVLRNAIKNHDYNTFKFLLENVEYDYNDLNNISDALGEKGTNDMMILIINKKIRFISALLDGLFYMVVMYDNIELMKFIIENKLKVIAEFDNYILHPLRYACECNNIKSVEFMLKNGVRADIRNNEAIKMANNKGYTEIVELLKQYGGTL